MFERNPENKRAIEAAWEIVKDRDRGELLKHEEAEKAFRVRRPADRYYTLIESLKSKMLKERGISLISVPLVGYELAVPDNQLALGLVRSKQAERRIRSGIKNVEALPPGECDFAQQRKRLGILDQMELSRRQIQTESQTIAFLMRPREQNPRLMPDPEAEAG